MQLRARRIRSRAALVATVIVTTTLVPARAQQSTSSPDPFAPGTTVETLRLNAAPIQLSPARARVLASRLVSQADNPDPQSALAALDLLIGAPQPVIEEVVKRLRETGQLQRQYASADQSLRSQYRNLQAVGYARLREFFAAEYAQELRQALAQHSVADLAYYASASRGFRTLTPDVAAALIEVVEASALDPQIRREFEAVLLQLAPHLQSQVERLRGWAETATAPDPPSARRRQLARDVLIRLALSLGDTTDLDQALASPDAQVRALAMSLLARPSTPFDVHRDALLEQMRREQDAGIWNQMYELLLKRDPASVQSLYSQITSQQATAWPAEIQATFILRAGPEHDLTLADWATSRPANCAERWRSLAILERRVRLGRDIIRDLQRAAEGKFPDCTLPRHDDVSLSALSVTLSRALDRAVRQARFDDVEHLLHLGIAPSATELERLGHWKEAFSFHLPQEIYERAYLSDLRIMRATRSSPPDTIGTVVALFEDTNRSPIMRAEALLSLSTVQPLAQNAPHLMNALADTNIIISRTALIILATALENSAAADSVPLPPLDTVENLLLQADLASDAQELLRRLVPRSDAFARTFSMKAPWDSAAGASCFALARASRITIPIAVEILESAASAAQSHAARLRACAGVLIDPQQPIAALVRYWDRMPAQPERVQSALKDLLTLWKDPEFSENASARLSGQVMLVTSVHAVHLPLSVSGQSLLSDWVDTLEKQHPREAQDLRTEFRKRNLIGLAVGIPAAFFLHLGFWVVLLWAYPHHPSVQSLFFWNPRLRKFVGAGYIDFVLLSVPFARRRLFAPFAGRFLGDIRGADEQQLDRIDYYPNSSVRHIPARGGVKIAGNVAAVPITTALSRHQGRVLLLGKSGLGKSSFLRNSLATRAAVRRDIIVYLRADECRNGVEAEIERRMQEFGRDQSLLRSVIYAGRIHVYIDGYNEVDLKTQDLITGFLANYPHGNILVASQIPLRGLTNIETYELQSLDRQQTRDFLSSRAAVLSDSSPVRGERFVAAAFDFLDDISARFNDPSTDKAFEEVLSNPMDLTSVALLIADARVPEIFALEEQQFTAVRESMAEAGTPFRVDALSRAVLDQRAADQENLGALPFEPEVIALGQAKLALVRTFADTAGIITSQEVRFRHDRIRDYFTHFAFLKLPPDKRATYAQDARFAGVYPFLARALPRREAETLREDLIRLAAEIEDHRVSDSFVREYSWRQRFAADDPEWMLTWDLPRSREAEAAYEDLLQKRNLLESAMNDARTSLQDARSLTRILTATRPDVLLSLSSELLRLLGASIEETSHPAGRWVRAPGGVRFLLTALAHPETLRPYHLDLLLARLADERVLIVLVTNSQVMKDPLHRRPDLDDTCLARLQTERIHTLSSQDLYIAFRHGGNSPAAAALWTNVEQAANSP